MSWVYTETGHLTSSQFLATAPSFTASDLSTCAMVSQQTGTFLSLVPIHASMTSCTSSLPLVDGADRNCRTKSSCRSWMPINSHLAPILGTKLPKMTLKLAASSLSLHTRQQEAEPFTMQATYLHTHGLEHDLATSKHPPRIMQQWGKPLHAFRVRAKLIPRNSRLVIIKP